MKIAVITLGCRTNQAESSRLESYLSEKGHVVIESPSTADLIILNSCTVTAKADRESRHILHQASKTGAQIIVTGCYSELHAETVKSISSSITVIPNLNKDSINELIPEESLNMDTVSKLRRQRPIVKVQDGCNHRCSYCVIPIARGRSRSIRREEVLKEVQRYISRGAEEIVLSGIHLGHYGTDLGSDNNLEILLSYLISNSGVKRIRLSSIELSEVTSGIADLIKSGHVCPHIHVPLQGGSDNLLKLMNRPYSLNQFIRGVEDIYAQIPGIAIGTDLIVGFPGETEGDLDSTMHTLKVLPLAYAHIFPFSSRTGTLAYNMPSHLPEKLKKERVLRVRELAAAKYTSFIAANIGLEHEIAVESVEGRHISGTSANYIKVRVEADQAIPAGKLVRVRLTERVNNFTVATLLN